MGEVIDAALRRQRIGIVLALGLGVLVGTVTVLSDVSGPAVLLTTLPLLVFVAMCVRYLARQPSRQAWRLDERAGVFHAPPRADGGYPAAMVGFMAYSAVTNWGRAGGGGWYAPLAVFFALAAVAFPVLLWRSVPGVVLSPEGIIHRRHERQWFVPWAALDPAGRVGSPRGTWTVRLPAARPELIRSGGGFGRGRQAVAVRDVDVAPALVSGALRYYLAQPGERAAIGTREGYDRLRAALSGAG